MSITTKDIADMCGISRGTVDRALNNRPGINEKTRKMVMDMAEKMGYQPNLLARSLVKGSTMTLGVVVFDIRNRFFAQLLASIESKARESGYFVYLTVANADPAEEMKCLEHLVSKKVDGIVLYAARRDEDFIRYLKTINIPVVIICNQLSDDLPFIGIDDRGAVVDAMRYLYERNYRKLLYVSIPYENKNESSVYAVEQRILGYREAYRRLGFEGEPKVSEFARFIRSFGKRDIPVDRKTAILCANDVCALEVMHNLKEKEISVPGDVGVMGFDNIDVLRYVSPSLSTIHYPIEDVGSKAVEYLLGRFNGGEIPGETILKHEIIDGASI